MEKEQFHKVEEEHVRISQAIKQAKLYNTTNDKADSVKEIQAHIGKGVVTGRFPVKEVYPPFPETDALTLAQQRRAGQGLAPAHYGRNSHRRETVIRHTSSLKFATNNNSFHTIPEESQVDDGTR